MTEEEEKAYVYGQRLCWLTMLRLCLGSLGVDDPEAGKVRWVIERSEVVAKLRDLCDSYGDNEWSDNLHLADVIEKHIDWESFK